MGPTEKRVKIPLHQSLYPPGRPRAVTVQPRDVTDFPEVREAHRALALKYTSPLLLGPALCDELMALIQHIASEEEADCLRYLGLVRGRSAAEVARLVRRPVDEVDALLRGIDKRRVIFHRGHGEGRRYHLLPIMPGMFESVMVGVELETISPWHRRFAECIAALYETGYFAVYAERRTPFVRYLPADGVARTHPLALPSDQLEIVVDRYRDFAVGQCQCRMSAKLVGRGCDRPLGNCSAMGDWAASAIRGGLMKRVSRDEYLEIKREANEAGLVNFIMNVELTGGQVSCSCCGCCCYVLRTFREHHLPIGVAQPHFQPVLDTAACNGCGLCAECCPTGALVLSPGERVWLLAHRCIGCGLCAGACRHDAVRIEPVAAYREPPDSWFGLIRRAASPSVRTLTGTWWQRLLQRQV